MESNAYQALRERCAFIDLTGRGKIRATGEDRTRLLHAMCTNHVQALTPGEGCYAFFLNPQGRILADANVFAMPDYVLLDTEPEAKQRIFEHLDKYIIADDVTLHDFTGDTATIMLEGPAAEQVLDEMGAMPAHAERSLVEWGHDSQVARFSYTGGPGYAIFVAAEKKQELLDQFSAALIPQADLATADVVRLEHFRPRFGVDFGEAQIPHETRLLDAIHFSKGCYLGQEIVERVRSRGHVNRLLTGFEIDADEAPASRTPVQADGKDVGDISSAAYSPATGKVLALGIVRTEALQPGVALSVAGARAVPVTRTA